MACCPSCTCTSRNVVTRAESRKKRALMSTDFWKSVSPYLALPLNWEWHQWKERPLLPTVPSAPSLLEQHIGSPRGWSSRAPNCASALYPEVLPSRCWHQPAAPSYRHPTPVSHPTLENKKSIRFNFFRRLPVRKWQVLIDKPRHLLPLHASASSGLLQRLLSGYLLT